MISKAKGRYLRMSPTKVRLVIDLIRGKRVSEASVILLHTEKGCSKTVGKVLKSALANAKQAGVDETQLYISKVTADGGSMWKRYRSAPFGRASGILKRTTHLTIELDLKTK